MFADIGDTDKHNNWNTTDNTDTITYDNNNKCYNLVKTVDGDSYIYFTDNIIPKNVKITYDMKTNDWSKNTQPRMGLSTGDEQVTGRFINNSGQRGIAILRHNNTIWDEFPITNVSTSQGNWYTVEIIVNGNSWTINLYDGDTLLGTASESVTTLSSNANKLILDNSYAQSSSISIRNIQVKPL